MKTAVSLIFLFLVTALPVFAVDEQPKVKVSQQRSGDVIQIFAENTSDSTLTITLALSDIKNAKSEGWPTKAVKRCLAGDSIMMTALIQTAGAPPATFTCTVTTSDQPVPQPRPAASELPRPSSPRLPPGPPPQKGASAPLVPVDANFSYRLPFPHGVRCNVSQGYNGRATHQNLYALDFEMPEGSPICASREGVVIEMKQDKDPGDSDSAIDNYVAIRHEDGTVALYLHLAKNHVNVNVGQHVQTGEVIGTSGNTGHSNGPHIHFEVSALKDCIGVTTPKGVHNTIPVVFDIYGGHKVSLVVGTTYEAE